MSNPKIAFDLDFNVDSSFQSVLNNARQVAGSYLGNVGRSSQNPQVQQQLSHIYTSSYNQLVKDLTNAIKKGTENRRAGAVDVGQSQNYNLDSLRDSSASVIDMLFKTWAKVTVVTGAIVAAGVAFDKLHYYINNVIFDQQRLAKEGIILEDYRLRVMQLQNEYLGWQLEISQQFNQSMQDASFLIEEIDRKLAQAEAKAEKEKNEGIANIENQQQKDFAALDKQFEKIQNDTDRGSWKWMNSFLASHDYKNDPNEQNMNPLFEKFTQYAQKQEFDINGEILTFWRNLNRSPISGIFNNAYKNTGLIQFRGEDKAFTNNTESADILRQIFDEIKKPREQRDIRARNVIVEDAREVARRRQIEAARESVPIEMGVLRNQQEKDYQRDVSNMINEIARTERSADATTYSIRMTQLNEEYEAQTQYLAKYETLRRIAAEEGHKDLTIEQKRILETELEIRKQIAGVRSGVNSAVNQILTPNSLAGLTGGVEDSAKVNQANTLQNLLSGFEKKSGGILNNKQLNDIQKINALDALQLKLNQDIEESAKRHAETLVLIRSHAADYTSILSSINGQEKQGAESMQIYQQNLRDMLAIEEDYRSQIQAATSEEERLTAEMEKQTQTAAKRLDLENGLRLAAEQYNMAKMQQESQRNRSEQVLKTGSDFAAESIQAVSDFRIKVFEGMRAGTLSAMDFEIAGQERVFTIRKAREQALHDQRMQDLKDYERQREQSINLDYEKATQADRQRIAELSKMLADPNLSASQRTEAESQLQQAQGNINAAENTRRTAMEDVRTNARGSVRAEAYFRENMSRVEARHKEQMSYLSAIASNTGKTVSSISDDYRQQVERSWSHSLPGIGMLQSQQRLSAYNSNQVDLKWFASALFPMLNEMVKQSAGLRVLPTIAAMPARMG
jgi:hypothetical protein